MATPSSSATSPSPPMAYVVHAVPASQTSSSSLLDPQEKEQRKRAVQKFLARAEISMVTRALRARLSYASYKATHNVPHLPLRELEARTQAQSFPPPAPRSIAAKRTAGPSSLRRSGSISQASPAISASPRTYYGAANGSSTMFAVPSTPAQGIGAAPAPSLYASLLSPPPHQARTVHNVSDLPITAPVKSLPSPRVRPSGKTAESTRTHKHGKSRLHEKAGPGSPSKRRAARSSLEKGKQKQKATDVSVDVDGDIDMKAAATLTSLLLHNRPSMAGSVSSPRSSIDGSEAGSTYSYSQFAQSSARTVATTSPPATSGTASGSTPTESSFRNQTPPPSAPRAAANLITTPRPAPTDNEAADLMLFLATSPSPARPTNRETRDYAAYRALSGGPGALRDKGRVLFQSPSASGSTANADDKYAFSAETVTPRQVSALTRGGGGGEASFSSSVSSIGPEMGMGGSRSFDGAPSRPAPTPSNLLPPPSLPSASSTTPTPRSPLARGKSSSTTSGSPKTAHASSTGVAMTVTPGASEFNFSEFINASPSPSRSSALGAAHRGNIGLRADVGRKLFEEEQMRHQQQQQQHRSAGLSPNNHEKRQDGRGLGAGIDLVQS